MHAVSAVKAAVKREEAPAGAAAPGATTPPRRLSSSSITPLASSEKPIAAVISPVSSFERQRPVDRGAGFDNSWRVSSEWLASQEEVANRHDENEIREAYAAGGAYLAGGTTPPNAATLGRAQAARKIAGDRRPMRPGERPAYSVGGMAPPPYSSADVIRSGSPSSESSASGSGSVPPSGVGAAGVWLSRKDIREAADRDNYRV